MAVMLNTTKQIRVAIDLFMLQVSCPLIGNVYAITGGLCRSVEPARNKWRKSTRVWFQTCGSRLTSSASVFLLH
jgi:hypothetical protein